MEMFGENLRSLRMEASLTQKQLADELGVSVSTVTSYEKAQKVPSLEIALKIARYFGVSLDWMCGGQNGRGGQVITYADAFRRIIDIAEALNMDIVNHSFERSDCCYGFTSEHAAFQDFIKRYASVRRLMRNKMAGLDDELFDLWVERQMREYNLKITGRE